MTINLLNNWRIEPKGRLAWCTFPPEGRPTGCFLSLDAALDAAAKSGRIRGGVKPFLGMIDLTIRALLLRVCQEPRIVRRVAAVHFGPWKLAPTADPDRAALGQWELDAMFPESGVRVVEAFHTIDEAATALFWEMVIREPGEVYPADVPLVLNDLVNRLFMRPLIAAGNG